MAIRSGAITAIKKLCSYDREFCEASEIKWKLEISNTTLEDKDVAVVDTFPEWLVNPRWTTSDGRTGSGSITETVTLSAGQTLTYMIIANAPETFCGAKTFTNCAIVSCGPCEEDTVYALAEPVVFGKHDDLNITPPFAQDPMRVLWYLLGADNPAKIARIIDWVNCGGTLLDLISEDELTKEDLIAIIQEPAPTVPGFPDVAKLFEGSPFKWAYEDTTTTVGSNDPDVPSLIDALNSFDPFGGTWGPNSAGDGVILISGDPANYTSLWNISADPSIECPFGEVTA